MGAAFCSHCGVPLATAAPIAVPPPSPSTAEQGKPRRLPRRSALLGGAAIALLAVAAITIWALGGKSLTVSSHLLAGELTLDETFGIDIDPWSDVQIGGSCAPQGTFAADIQTGTAVVIEDGTGVTLATTAITGGTKQAPGKCAMAFSATVADAEFYKIKVAQRPESVFSKTELEAMNWKVSLSLQASL